MVVCAGCRARPCRCGSAPEDVVERMLAIRARAAALSLEYLMWLDGNGQDPEPALPPDVREDMRDLVAEMERVLES